MACACKHKSGQVTSVKQVVKKPIVTRGINTTTKKVTKKIVVRRPI